MEQDNRGLTLIELIVAMTMAVIVMGAAGVFIGSAMRSFQKASDTIDLQMESQVMMEQVSTWIMEGNRVQTYEDSSYGTVLVIYRIPRIRDKTNLPDIYRDKVSTESEKTVLWCDGSKLYMKEEGGIVDADHDSTDLEESDTNMKNCVGEYVSGFRPSIDASNHAKVTVEITLTAGQERYELKNTIKIRNELM